MSEVDQTIRLLQEAQDRLDAIEQAHLVREAIIDEIRRRAEYLQVRVYDLEDQNRSLTCRVTDLTLESADLQMITLALFYLEKDRPGWAYAINLLLERISSDGEGERLLKEFKRIHQYVATVIEMSAIDHKDP